MDRLVGAHGYRPGDPLQQLVAPGGQGLLDQLEARRSRNGEKRFGFMRLPGLVGIGDEPRLRHRGAHGADALGVARAAELDLEQGIIPRLACRRRHRLRRGQREGEGGEHRAKRRQSRQRRGAPARPLCFQVP